MPRINSASELEELRKGVLSERDPDKPSIAICAGMGCHSLGNGRIISAIEEEINDWIGSQVIIFVIQYKSGEKEVLEVRYHHILRGRAYYPLSNKEYKLIEHVLPKEFRL